MTYRNFLLFSVLFLGLFLLFDKSSNAVAGQKNERDNNLQNGERLSQPREENKERQKINEASASRAQYFSWINNTNEGPTEKQTLINLEFFEWLRKKYGMQLDIYAFDAGTIDGKRWYGSVDSERFKKQFPSGFDRIFKKASSLDMRLGVWGGPDGFGVTAEEEFARSEQMISLCRDYDFALFKFDAVAGQLRDEKQEAFAKMMQSCRDYTPDLILLNHRLNLGEIGTPHATTFLWEGKETYIDVHLWNESPAIHSRAGALSRGLPPKLSRLTEDHGVCLSNALDYWDDELVLQAFNRALILSPQIYCNPWFLRDDEYPKLARIFNLAKRYGDILVNGIILPEEQYGPSAVSRGDQHTRLITLRNLNWKEVTYSLSLDETVGLYPRDNEDDENTIEVRQYHPGEKIIGNFAYGHRVDIKVPPFRSALIRVTNNKSAHSADDVEVSNITFEVLEDVVKEETHVRLVGKPGETRKISIQGRKEIVSFRGDAYVLPFHRKLAELKQTGLPVDAEALYETSVYAASNDALEVQAIERSKKSEVAQVKEARKAFFAQDAFIDRGLWDRYMFDGNPKTAFYRSQRWLYNWNVDPDASVAVGALRVDFGRVEKIDQIVLKSRDVASIQPLKLHEGIIAQVSADLKTWHEVRFLADTIMHLKMPAPNFPVRYLRLAEAPQLITEIEAYADGKKIDRSDWQGSNLFGDYEAMHFKDAWSATFTPQEIAPDSYLTVAVPGQTGHESVYAALRVGGRVGGHIVGAPERSPAYPANTWELQVHPAQGNYSFYIPVKPQWAGQEMEVILLTRDGVMFNDADALAEKVEGAQVWISRRPVPLAVRDIIVKN